MAESEQFERGLEIRREVLGTAYVDANLAGTDEFMMGFQRLLTEWAWGYAWSRPGLDRKTRSMLNLAILTALGRPQELGIYVKGALSTGVSVAEIQEVLLQAATHPEVDVVVNAVVGAAGLDATLAALRAGKRVALANKETLVMAGDLVAQAACAGGGELVPVDSEHSAVLQCVTGRDAGLCRLIITCSGGPFREWPPA